MKRLIPFLMSLILALSLVGVVNGQNSVEWRTETLKYTYDTGTAWAQTVATQSDTAMMDSTFYSNSIELPEYRIDKLSFTTDQDGNRVYVTSVEEKFPTKISIRTTATEYNLGDSLYVINTLQLSDDASTWYDYAPIDTLIDIATAGSAQTEFEIFTSFPEFRYARVKHYYTTSGADILDTLFHSGAISRSWEE